RAFAPRRPSQLSQPARERRDPFLQFWIVLGQRYQHATPPHALTLLRARRERPCRRRAAEKGDEIAPFHSITSSARSHSGRPPNMNTTPAQLETPRPTPPRYLV